MHVVTRALTTQGRAIESSAHRARGIECVIVALRSRKSLRATTRPVRGNRATERRTQLTHWPTVVSGNLSASRMPEKAGSRCVTCELLIGRGLRFSPQPRSEVANPGFLPDQARRLRERHHPRRVLPRSPPPARRQRRQVRPCARSDRHTERVRPDHPEGRSCSSAERSRTRTTRRALGSNCYRSPASSPDTTARCRVD
jgi:hypothetical protein